jgi:uncharacterized protein
MRSTNDLPGRRGQARPPSARRRRRIFIIAAIVALVILVTSLRGIAGFYTDYLWFQSMGQTSVWRGLLGARVVLALIFILLFFGLAWVNLFVADRLAPPFRPAGPEDELLERYHEVVAGRMGKIRVAVAGFLALIAGVGAGGEWNSWLLFVNGGDFGVEDPQFGYDAGFYVFRLPFISFVIDWLFASLLIILIVTAVAHYLNGGIRVQSPAARVTPQVKAHLSLLLAALAGIRAVDYWFDRFELTTSSRGVVDGATYTDVNAQLPVLNLLILISVAAAILFIVNIFRRGWTLPVLAVALWGFVAVVASGIYPAYVQRFQVQPNESAREAEYIERNQEATRFALGVDDERVERVRINPVTDPDDVTLADYEPTLRNVRLWDPADPITANAFQQQQGRTGYFDISNITIDRYMVNGELTGTGLGIRSVVTSRIPSPGWEGQHLAYTRGYGVVAAPSGITDAEGYPSYVVRDIPVQSDDDVLGVEQPFIYFGQDLDGDYVMVNTGRNEIDYAAQGLDDDAAADAGDADADDADAGGGDTGDVDADDGDDAADEPGGAATNYDGEDGVGAGSLLNRVAFALRFGDINPIISGFMGSDTRVIFHRDISDRIGELAPFLHADADPYAVVLDGRVVWVQDLYTTTDRFPYAQRADTDQLSNDSGLRHRFNYVRNSVKATVDAYDGTVTFYVVEEDDPIVQAWRNAFPSLFTDASEMPEGLEDHLRYPEDMFRVQTEAWQRYHLEDPFEFYDADNAWTVARDPGTAGADPATVVTDPASGEATGETRAPRIPPYYQILQLPGETDPEFVLMRPFAPISEDDERQQLTGYMAARMDPGKYGQIVVYETPRGQLPPGPGIASRNIRANPEVGQLRTLLDQAGSNVLLGNLLTIPLGGANPQEPGDPDGPVDTALLYVQPFYVEPNVDNPLPQLARVIAVFGEEVVIATSFQDALEQLFGERLAVQELEEDPVEEILDEDEVPTEPDDAEPDEADEPDVDQAPAEPPTDALPDIGDDADEVTALLAEAAALFAEADEARSEGDVSTWVELVTEGVALFQEAMELLEAGGNGEGESPANVDVEDGEPQQVRSEPRIWSTLRGRS